MATTLFPQTNLCWNAAADNTPDWSRDLPPLPRGILRPRPPTTAWDSPTRNKLGPSINVKRCLTGATSKSRCTNRTKRPCSKCCRRHPYHSVPGGNTEATSCSTAARDQAPIQDGYVTLNSRCPPMNTPSRPQSSTSADDCRGRYTHSSCALGRAGKATPEVLPCPPADRLLFFITTHHLVRPDCSHSEPTNCSTSFTHRVETEIRLVDNECGKRTILTLPRKLSKQLLRDVRAGGCPTRPNSNRGNNAKTWWRIPSRHQHNAGGRKHLNYLRC
jgi:hypothetical protein